MIFVDTIRRLIYYQDWKMQRIRCWEPGFIPVKVFARIIKRYHASKHFIKVTAPPSFMRLIVIRQINRVH